ncbi:MAG: hypothetical protein LBG10_05790 [Treponema sp.]|nr:hypothetical protein [Treponema sp.]
MKKKHGVLFGIFALFIAVIFMLTACSNPAGGGGGGGGGNGDGDGDEPDSPTGIWTGTWTGTDNTSLAIELEISSGKYDFVVKGKGTRDEGTWSQSEDRITFTSTLGTGQLGWATITGNKMTFNVTLSFFVTSFKCTGGQLTKTGSTEPSPKTIVISGFPGSTYNGKTAILMLYDSLDSLLEEEDPAAVGGVSITSASKLTIPLKTDESLKTDWKGSGSYIVVLAVGDEDDDEDDIIIFVYTNGSEPNSSG